VSQEEYEEDSENEGNVDIKVNRGKMKVKRKVEIITDSWEKLY
jgi:hypothetical protein